jgi:CBS domain-containing protein
MEVELEKIGIQRENKILSIASLNPLVASIGERITEVCKKLAESGHRSLPVIDRKMQLRGIVSITDVFALLLSGGTMTSPVENIMSREVVRCGANETIEYVLQKMKISKRGRLPITSNNKLIGIVSEADFISAVKDASALDNIKIEEVMVRKPFFVAPSFSIKEVMRTMVNGKYRRLPIVENGKLVGYITSTLLFKHAVENSFSSSFLGKKVAEVMTKNPITVGKSEKLSSVLKKMKERKVSSMLIVDEKKRLEGIFTERDFINLLV